MDREKVIKGLETCSQKTVLYVCGQCPYNNDDSDTYDCTQALSEDALALLKEQEWIPVSERLPRSMANKVLVYLRHEDLVDQIGYGHYEKFQGQEMWYDLETHEQFSKRGYTVTHWMPLPLSPDGSRLALS